MARVVVEVGAGVAVAVDERDGSTFAGSTDALV